MDSMFTSCLEVELLIPLLAVLRSLGLRSYSIMCSNQSQKWLTCHTVLVHNLKEYACHWSHISLIEVMLVVSMSLGTLLYFPPTGILNRWLNFIP